MKIGDEALFKFNLKRTYLNYVLGRLKFILNNYLSSFDKYLKLIIKVSLCN